MTKGKPHQFPPPAPIGGMVCCWPRCDESRSAGFGDMPDFPLCATHAMHAFEAIVVEQRKLTTVIAVHEEKRNQNLPVSDREKRSHVGWVYFVRVGDRIKVGHAVDLSRRIKAYPPDSVLLAVMPGSRADEAALHQELTPWRTAGREWYQSSSGVMRRIEAVLRQHGTPPSLDPKPWDTDYVDPPPRMVRG